MSSDREALVGHAADVFGDATASSTNENDDDNAGDGGDKESNSVAKVEHTRWFILEPAVFLTFFSMSFCGAVYQNQILYQACVTVFHYNESSCEPLLGIKPDTEEAREIETVVQPYVANILMTRSMLESIIPALLSLFIGPWSDKYGRRPLLLGTFSGYLLSLVATTNLTFISSTTNINPWLFLLSSIPIILSGGICTLITGTYCYISDMVKERDRTMRMVLNEGAICLGGLLGNVTGGYLYAATNAVTVFVVASTMAFLCVVYIYVCAEESIQPQESQTGSRICDFFHIDLVKDLLRTCFKRRPNYDRAILWLAMGSLIIALFILYGDENVFYLFVRKKFDWTVKDYALFNSANSVKNVLGTVMGLVLLKKLFKLSGTSMAMLSVACCVLEMTVRATAMYNWEMYLSMALGLFGGLFSPMIRSIMSQYAPSNEIGKIFALTTSLESVTPLVSAPLYTAVYDLTLAYNPGLYNFINAGLYLLCYTFLSTIYGIQKTLGQFASGHNNSNSNEV